MTTDRIKNDLFNMQDLAYRDFHSRLVPTLPEENIIGVRMPVLRRMVKDIVNDEQISLFLSSLPHKYYEENNIHALIINQIKDFDACLAAVENFIPFIDNWATCDCLKPKCFFNNPQMLLQKALIWIQDEQCYVRRFGIGVFMNYFLECNFDSSYNDYIAKIRSDEYYVNMMKAWYFATALAKQYDSTVCVLEEKKLDKWSHNKTICKASESFRISQKQKEYLRTLKI